MRSLVGIITTIATVIHFTFGCCLHPCHAAARGDRVTNGIGSFACDGCCTGHEHEADRVDSAGMAEGRGCSFDGIRLVAAPSCDACHGCDGCHCAATSTETGWTFPWPQAAAAAAALGDGVVIPPFAGAGRRPPPDPHVHPPRGRTALFERFLT